ncbi:outer membrane beta-barrel protein [Vibrio variabilis]|uniref:outer membrane beta-barrel protein n=1 Tax=Vibrio variabilis TaxID=990271 RepID=UPI000DD796FD|nr:outer membrane beta-barrel protein [Vibrio variabilis]
MKLKNKLLLLSTSLFALPTLAQGLYAGASIGYGNQHNVVHDLSTATGYLMAGYRFNENIGAEYRFGGVNTHDSYINDLRSYNSLYVRGSYEIDPGFEVYGLAGFTQARGGDYFSNGSRTTSSPSFGLGARFEIAEELGLNAEYVSVISKREYSLSAVYFGIDYRF